MENQTEIWKSHPDIVGIEVSTFGNVRTLDRLVSSEKYTRFTEGLILKQYKTSKGYQMVSIPVDGKWIMKRVHRLVAETFIPNPDNLPMVNHKNCVRDDNRVKNLEWCDNSYNQQYREKYGEALGHPVYAINLKTQEVLRFDSQSEASRELVVRQGDISAVIRGRQSIASGYWFVEDNGDGFKIDKNKLCEIKSRLQFRGGIYAISLDTQKVSYFKSQREAGRSLGIGYRNINAVLTGNCKTAGRYWFVKDDGHAVEAVKSNLHDVGGVGIK